MALPDYAKESQGTAIIWGHPGGSGVTKNLSLNNLANTKARMGVYADLGANRDTAYQVQLIVETGTAPTAGKTVHLYLACCDVTSRWPGGVDGTDAPYKDGEENEWVKQLGNPAAFLIATNDADTVQKQEAVIWRPNGRYVAPVVVNKLGQAFRNEGTPANNDSRVVLVPIQFTIQDTA